VRSAARVRCDSARQMRVESLRNRSLFKENHSSSCPSPRVRGAIFVSCSSKPVSWRAPVAASSRAASICISLHPPRLRRPRQRGERVLTSVYPFSGNARGRSGGVAMWYIMHFLYEKGLNVLGFSASAPVARIRPSTALLPICRVCSVTFQLCSPNKRRPLRFSACHSTNRRILMG
jgi:hypothetical protein